jgi:hypothetical protein
VEGVQAVQTGVYYAPGIEFCAFDLATRSSDSAPHAYVDFEQALPLFAAASLLHAVPLFVGPWNQCLSFNLPFASTIPARLGLPALRDNKAEGIVIKSMREMRFSTRQGGVSRAMIKKKIPEFAEDRRFHQAQRWTAPAAASHLPPLTVLLLEVEALLVENRLAAAISKIGPLVAQRPDDGQLAPLKARVKQVLTLMEDDVREELSRRLAQQMTMISAADRLVLEGTITEQAKRLILEHIKTRTESPSP